MDAWVAGATGLVGAELVELLLDDARVKRVTTLVRRSTGRTHAKLVERVVDFDRLEQALEGECATHVFSCLGTTIKKAGSQEAFRKVDYEYGMALGRVARKGGATLLVVTALGAALDSMVFYNRVKGELERDLEALELPRLCIFRPSLLLGERAEHRAGERIGMAVGKPLGALLFGPLRKYRPIAGKTVARAMVRVAFETGAFEQGEGGARIYESDAISRVASA